MSFVCCFWILGFSENRQFAPRPLVRAANLLAETWEKLDLLSSRRDPLCAPRTAWQKVWDFLNLLSSRRDPLCAPRTAWQNQGTFDSLSSRRELLLAPRTLFYSTFSKL